MGKNLAITGHSVRFADGSESTMPYHIRPDGAGVFTKEDGSGYYYAVNSEYGDGPDGELWGGVYSLGTLRSVSSMKGDVVYVKNIYV